MTEDNKRANAADELVRAERELRAAELLFARGLWGVSLGRSYYAVFHLTEALLFSRGLQARKHAGVFHLFHQEFPDLSAWNGRLERLKKGRETADYETSIEITETQASAALADAREFDALVRARLGA